MHALFEHRVLHQHALLRVVVRVAMCICYFLLFSTNLKVWNFSILVASQELIQFCCFGHKVTIYRRMKHINHIKNRNTSLFTRIIILLTTEACFILFYPFLFEAAAAISVDICNSYVDFGQE